jgi:hypothetical protein
MTINQKDIVLIYEAVEIVLHSGLPRGEREKFLRLRDRLAPLYRKAIAAEEERRAARGRTAERRSARKMPSPSVIEADDWHAFLGGSPRRP